ncbi:hypothetical protein F5888DRAFT_1632041 [Russula emetica]|nr:hypothetical protein F5888DRAFT_1632041 [Russula emetica]
MTHGYSLRPNTKGRRKHQSIDKTDDQVEGTTSNTSTSTSNTSERGHETLTDKLVEAESGTVDPRPITPDTPRAAAHNNSPTQDSAKQDDWQQRHLRRSIVTSSAVITGATTTTATGVTPTRYRVNGPPQTWEDIQAARKREEARRIVEAKRIRREQIVRGYEEELRSLRARIVALRRECEVKVEKVRRKWERDWVIEQGEVAVVVEDGEEEALLVGRNEDEDWAPDADSKMEIIKDYVPTETSSVTTDNDDHQQWQWSSRSTPCWSRSKSDFQPPPFQITQKQQQQHLQSQRHQPHRDTGTSPLSAWDMMMVSPSCPLRRRLEPEATEEDSDERGPPAVEKKTPSQGQARKSHPQPLRRQPAQLMVLPTSSPSPSHGLHTYATAVVDPVQISFGGTDGDNDSEMDG